MKTGKHYNRVQVYLPDDLAILFESYCNKHELNGSAGAKKIIHAYLSQEEKPEIKDYSSSFTLTDKIQSLEAKIKQLSAIILENQQNISMLGNRQGSIILDLEAYKKLIPSELPNELVTELKRENLKEASYQLIKDSEEDLANEKFIETVLELSSDSDTDSNTELPTDSNTDSNTDSKTNSNTELSTDSKTNSNTELPTDSKTNFNTELPTDSNTELSTDSKANSDTESEDKDKYFLEGYEFTSILEQNLDIGFILHTEDKEDTNKLYIGGQKRTFISGNPKKTRLYKTFKNAEKSAIRYTKAKNQELIDSGLSDSLDKYIVREAKDLLQEQDVKTRFALIKYWGIDELFLKSN